MAITAVQSGVWYRFTADLPPEIIRQLKITNGLWNSLVTSYRQYEADVAEVWSSFPAIAAIETSMKAVDEEIETLVAEIKKARAAQHGKTSKLSRVNTPATKVLAAKRKEYTALRKERKARIEEVHSVSEPMLTAALEARNAREKLMYSQFVLAGGYWGTFNDVRRDRFTTALKRSKLAAKQGQPSKLRTHRPRPSGTLTVQLQKGTGAQERTPEQLASADSSWRNVLSMPYIDRDTWEDMPRGKRRQAGRGMIRMRIGQDESGSAQHVDIPVQIHRQLPRDAIVTQARLTIRQVGPDLRASVVVIANVPDPEPRAKGPMVMLHLGWAQHDQGIQIASWASTSPLSIPAAWRHVIIPTDGRRVNGVIVIPERVAQRLAHVDGLHSKRDQTLNELKETVARWVETNGPLPSPYRDDDGQQMPPLTAGQIRQWRSPGRFVVLRRYLRQQADVPGAKTSAAGRELLAQLDAWAIRDAGRWRAQEHGRAHVLDHRDDVQKNVAAVFASQAAILVIDDTNIAELSRRPKVASEREDEWTLPAVARRRVIGAPGRQRQYCVMAATREGAKVVKVSAKNLSLEHAACGHVNEPAILGPDGMRECAGCNRRYNPNASTLVLMQRRAYKIIEEDDELSSIEIV